ncbi:MAG: type II 3-dehydroquinate dehydratase, partial [Coriobacteriales bacterium]|nr:type II 3-dehydroquinate dehydratase [Coriobacteriales bacterium]
EAGSDALFPMSRPDSNIRVTINRSPKHEAEKPSFPQEKESLLDASDLGILEGIFSDGKSDDADDADDEKSLHDSDEPLGKLLVVNGPNINLLGIDERAHANWHDFPTLLGICKDTAQDCGFSRCDCIQSNHEGDLIDIVQDAWCAYEGIVINPTAYGNSRGVRDAIRQVGVPTVEVHLHNCDDRDEVSTVCQAVVCGKGTDGYREAILKLASLLRS